MSVTFIASAVMVGCTMPDEPATHSGTQDIDTSNGIWENGLTTNGIWENGIWENGIWENGIWENGIWENGIWENGIWENGIWENGLWQANPTALATLRTNPFTRKFLQYVYSCAVPAGRSKVLDPGRTGACSKTTTATCVHDSECPADEVCLGGELDLTGAIGVGINEGASSATWDLDGGSCDETCQRWTSACLLARTNAYGVHVHISMRAPEDAPQPIKNALAIADTTERDTYSHREGSYYGNLFATGTLADPIQLYACAGPESNVPEITNRFCSSAGDDGPIGVVGSCLPAGSQTGVCGGEDTDPSSPSFGGIQECHGWNGSGPYKEVITVFLADPIAVCGNNVCEGDDEIAHCPSDCHPGTWGSTIDTATGVIAVAPDDSIARFVVTDQAIDVGGGTLPATGHVDIAFATFGADGTYQAASSHRISAPGIAYDMYATPSAIALPTGDHYVVGGREDSTGELWVAKLTSAGALEAGWPKFYGAGDSSPPQLFGVFASVTNGVGAQPTPFATAVGADGSLFVGGIYEQSVTFGGTTLSTGTVHHGFLTKLLADGTVAWAKDLGTVVGPTALYVDGAGDVWAMLGATLAKRSGATGAAVFSKSVTGANFAAMTEDGSGNIYLTGSITGPVDFGNGHVYTADSNQSLVVVSYAPDGTTVRWVYQAQQTNCEVLQPDCVVTFQGYRIGFDRFRNLVIGGMGGSDSGGTINLGAGPYEGYGTEDIYVAAFSLATGAMQWSKHVPLILNGVLQDMWFTSTASVVMSGAFSGSMLADGKLLVSTIPEDPFHYNTFLASFQAPAPDRTPPVMLHVPENIHLAAWKNPAGDPPGAVGWFMPPVAVDDSSGGTNVHCDSQPTAWLPIGTTTVHCTAYDAFGNASAPASFTITVGDLAGPVLSNIPADRTVAAAGPSGSIVTYTAPSALDDLDGPRTVSCTPASGSLFPQGTTAVTCSASDMSGNTSHATFRITVRDITPPVIAVPAPVTAEATGPAGAVVTYTATANDNIDGPVTPDCTPASGSTFALGTTTVSCTATDAAGNVAHATFTVTVRDTTPPVLTLPATITVDATTSSGSSVTYAASAYDLVDGAIAPTCTPASGSLFALGPTTVTCTATDAHGNTGTGTFLVQVHVAWTGILQPINADGSSVFHAGSTVPVKFALTGASAGITDLYATLSLAKVSAGIEGTVFEATSTSAADTGNQFRYDPVAQQYIFNLATTGLTKGTWRLAVDLHDGVTHSVDISLK